MDRNREVNRRTRRPGILVVDSEPVVRMLLDRILPGEGFAIWLASNGKEALELFRLHHHEIDLALLEVRLPGLSGPQTLAALRQVNPQVRCCFMSGCFGDDTELELLEQGAALLNKPFGPDEVVALLRQLLGTPHGGPHVNEKCPSVLSWCQWGAG